MLRYETLILARTQITADEYSMLENFFDKTLSDIKGKLNSFDRWGKYRLVYPIKRNDYGVYILVRYQFPKQDATDFFKKVETFFKIKCNEIVIRHVTVKLDSNAPLSYKYPESIDADRSGNLDSFLKENKMESLLDDVKSSGQEGKEGFKQDNKSVEKSEDTKEINTEN